MSVVFNLNDGSFDNAIYQPAIVLTKNPVASVTYIKRYDPSNIESTFSASAYRLANKSNESKIVINSGFSWPLDVRMFESFVVRCVIGFASASEVPQTFKEAVLQQVAFRYKNRFTGEMGLLDSVKTILQPYVMRHI